MISAGESGLDDRGHPEQFGRLHRLRRAGKRGARSVLERPDVNLRSYRLRSHGEDVGHLGHQPLERRVLLQHVLDRDRERVRLRVPALAGQRLDIGEARPSGIQPSTASSRDDDGRGDEGEGGGRGDPRGGSAEKRDYGTRRRTCERLEPLCHLTGRPRSIGRVFLEEVQNELFELHRQLGSMFPGWFRIDREDRRDGLALTLAGERERTGQHLVEHDPERP